MDNRNNPCNKNNLFVTLFLFKFWFKDNLSHYRPYLFLHIFPIYWWFLNVRNIRYLFAYSPFRGDGQKHPFMKNEQKVPNGIEIYAVKPNISSIRCVFFGQTSPRGEFVLFDHIHSFYSNDYFWSRSQGFQSKHIPNLFLINR